MFNKRKLRKLSHYYADRKWEALISLSLKLQKSRNISLKKEALRYGGLACYKKHDFVLSATFFSQLVLLDNYKSDWFNLAMANVKIKNFEAADEAFQKIYGATTIQGYLHQLSVPNMIHLYTGELYRQGAFDISLKRLNELKQMYVAANTSNEERLLASGLPGVKSFYHLSLKVLKQFPHIDCNKWFGEIKKLSSVFSDCESD